ncbi:MAG: hypothetical protein JRD05_02490 [Deltaproteobacteria bacterium]|nr:hypothetical protein [Deltaproteobacteria bacterium]
MKIRTTRSENNNPKKAEGTEAEGRRAEGRLTSSVFLILKYSSLTANLFFNDKIKVLFQTLIIRRLMKSFTVLFMVHLQFEFTPSQNLSLTSRQREPKGDISVVSITWYAKVHQGNKIFLKKVIITKD